jgi:hypothetical protein
MSESDKKKVNDECEMFVSLRPFPYPFKAGLAICSDIDGCDRETFVNVHRYLNTDQQGLGLPVSDSFFGFGREPGQMAYFLDDVLTPSKDADFIIQAIREGLIDSIHSWGDFNNGPPDPVFLRKLAEKVLERISAHNLKIPIWINHGDPANCHNLKARLRPSYNGDDPGSPYYTADLLPGLGIRFYWWSELLPWPLSGRLKGSSPVAWRRLIINAIKNSIKRAIKKEGQIRTPDQLMKLALPVRLRNDSVLFGFTRFSRLPGGIWKLPNRHTLRYSLSAELLNDLVKQEGYLILYTHLGLPKKPQGELFPKEDRKALTGLAERYHSGSIWVARTVDLLTFWMVKKNLVWKSYAEGEKLIINLESLDDPTTGTRLPEADDLAGLCFYSPKPESTIIRLNSRQMESVINKPDHTGKSSVGFPLPPVPGTNLLEE